MKSFGINVPDGQPAHSVEDVERIAPVMADDKGEVSERRRRSERGRVARSLLARSAAALAKAHCRKKPTK